MSLRNQRQQELADKWIERGMFGIINACPRFGKIALSHYCINSLDSPCSILIAYPDKKIRQQWINEFERLNYDNPDITYVTHLSLKKYRNSKFDLVIIDEVHLLSEAQISVCVDLFGVNEHILALTGTLSSWTERILKEDLGLPVVAYYPIEKAIEEGIITDYEIEVVTVPLDRNKKLLFGKKLKTEKKKYDEISWVIDKLEEEGKDTKFLRLARMRIIQHSLAKLNKTKELIEQYKDERILVFCGLTEIADKLGIPSYHSKSSEKDTFEKFLNGEINHLAVCKIGSAGVTFSPLNRVIINSFDSNPEVFTQRVNRCMSLEYDNLDKKAHISIITTDEYSEGSWLKKALEFFDKSKIKYL